MVGVKVFSTGAAGESDCEIALQARENSHWIRFESADFTFNIVLKDIVDLEDFSNFLLRKNKKTVLHCNLKKGDKEYHGPRKILWKNGYLAVSQGGLRLEFCKVTQEQLRNIVSVLKNR